MIPIPPEILHLIIENTQKTSESFHWDRCSLEPFTRVCQSWTPIAQTYLFRTTNVNIGERPIDDFLEYLRRAPYIADAIQTLVLWRDRPVDDDDDDGLAEPSDEPYTDITVCVSPVRLLQLLLALRALSYLKLDLITVLGWPKNVPFPTERVKLSRLGMFGVRYAPFLDPETFDFDFLTVFELDEIWLGCNRIIQSEAEELLDVMVLPTPAPPIIRSLRVLKGSDCFLRLNHERGGIDASHVRSVKLSPEDMASLQFAGMLLQRYGANIKDLEFSVCSVLERERPDGTRIWNVSSFSSCTNVETLTFPYLQWGGLSVTGLVRYTEYSEACGALLASTPPSLHHLSFCISASRTIVDFVAMAALLAPRIVQALGRFPRLKSVTLDVKRTLDRRQCLAALRHFLPASIMDAGVLRLVSTSPVCE
ncbi:hypothetical protein BD413DRAFT_469418 [Trametes elegans]|nr:hypothetical protein BD413DRAFT_469418 [Trametes elegans]